MQTQRWGWTHRYAVPMFVASIVAVLLAGSAAVAFLAVYRDDGGTGPGGGSNGTPSHSEAGIDTCVVGTWRVVSQTERLPTSAGTMVLDGDGAVFEFRPDGTGQGDYGDGTTFTATAFGQNVVLTVTGPLTYQYEAAGGTFQFVAIDSGASYSFDVLPIEDEFSLSQEPVSYRCEEDTLRFHNQEGYAAEYQKVAP